MSSNPLDLNQLTMDGIDFEAELPKVTAWLDEVEKECKEKYGDDGWEHDLADTNPKYGIDIIEEWVNDAIFNGELPCVTGRDAAAVQAKYWEKMKRQFGPFYKKYIDHEPNDPKANEALVRDALGSGKWRELPKPLQAEYHKRQENFSGNSDALYKSLSEEDRFMGSCLEIYGENGFEYYLAITDPEHEIDIDEMWINEAIFEGHRPRITCEELAGAEYKYWEKMKRLFGPSYKDHVSHKRHDSKVNEALIKDALKSGKWKELPEPLQYEYQKRTGNYDKSVEISINEAIYHGSMPFMTCAGSFRYYERYDEKVRQLFGPFWKWFWKHEPNDPIVNRVLLKDALKRGKWDELPKELQTRYHRKAAMKQ